MLPLRLTPVNRVLPGSSAVGLVQREILRSAGRTASLRMTPTSRPGRLAGQTVDFGGHDEVTFGEAVDLVRPQGDFGFAPDQQDVGMVALLFGERADFIDEIERLLEVGKLELAVKVMLVGNIPLRYASAQLLNFFAFEGGNASAAGDALLVGKLLGRRFSRLGHAEFLRGEGSPGKRDLIIFFLHPRIKYFFFLS